MTTPSQPNREERFNDRFLHYFQSTDRKNNSTTAVMLYSKMMEVFEQEIAQALAEQKEADIEDFKKIIGKHNASILNQFQLQGTADMPMIAYDERVCLIPAIEKATSETIASITEPKP